MGEMTREIRPLVDQGAGRPLPVEATAGPASATIRRLAIAVLIGLAIAGFATAYLTTGFQGGIEGGDSWVYLAAGERLNAGHALYALTPTDRPVLIVPPYWTVPLLAPPPIAVVWRPLAALGPASMDLWSVLNLVSTAATVLYLAARGGLVGLGTVALLAGPLGLLALSGNVNGFVLAALVMAWRSRDRPVLVGPFVAFAVAMKLTPVLLLFWLLGSRRIPAVVATAVSLTAIAIISIAGAGLDAHLDWLRTVPGSQPSPQSISATLHLPAAVVSVAGALVVAAIAWRGSERWAFASAVIVSCLITPAFYFQALGLMAAAAAPWTTPGASARSTTAPLGDPTMELPA